MPSGAGIVCRLCGAHGRCKGAAEGICCSCHSHMGHRKPLRARGLGAAAPTAAEAPILDPELPADRALASLRQITIDDAIVAANLPQRVLTADDEGRR